MTCMILSFSSPTTASDLIIFKHRKETLHKYAYKLHLMQFEVYTHTHTSLNWNSRKAYLDVPLDSQKFSLVLDLVS